MAKIPMVCPNPACRNAGRVDESLVGNSVRCKKCGTKFPVTRPDNEPLPAAPTAPGSAPLQERPNGERDVPAHWHPGDVILELYEVRPLPGAANGYAEGGLGRVNLVRHREWQVDLAVKSVNPEKLTSGPGAVAEFLREAEEWVNRVGLHPHVVGCYYVRVLGGLPRVFVEYVAGGNLREWIGEGGDGRLYAGTREEALARVLDIGIQFAWGLHYVHELGMVHQDVKPDNVMLTADGIAKVTDFGLTNALALNPEGESPAGKAVQATCHGRTFEYCSPEQAEIVAKRAGGVPRDRCGKLTPRTDLWSWAVSVLEMFKGARRWMAGNLADRAVDAKKVSDRIPEMPKAVTELLRQCLQRKPEDRPRDLDAVADRLQEVYEQETGRTYPRELPVPSEMLAAQLNNRAVSLLDLDKPDEALRALDEAVEADPLLVEAAYNRGLLCWRGAKCTDEEVLRDMREATSTAEPSWRSLYLLAQVHYERGDCEEALAVLQSLSPEDASRETITEFRNRATTALPQSPRSLRVLEGNEEFARSVSTHGDGRWLLSGGMREDVRLWETETGKCIRAFKHDRSVCSVCLSGDGQRAIVGGTAGMIRLWEVGTGKCVHIFQGDKSPVFNVSMSKDGRLALSGSGKVVQLWETETGKCVRTFEGHSYVHSVCLSKDGQLAMVGSDKVVRLWGTETGKCVRTFEGHTGDVSSVCLSKDGQLAMSGAKDGTVRLWNTRTGGCVRTFEGHSSKVQSVCLSNDARWALSGGGGTVRLWETETGKCIRTFEGDAGGGVCLSNDEQLAMSGGGGTIRLWKPSCSWSKKAASALSPVSSSGNNQHQASKYRALISQARIVANRGDFARAARKIHQARSQPGYLRHPEALELWASLYVHLDRGSLQAAWRARTFNGHLEGVSSVCLSGDGRLALSGGQDKVLRLWEVRSGKCIRTFEGHDNRVTSVCLSSDGHRALSGSWDNTVRLWEVATGECVRTFEGHETIVESVCLSGNGRSALSGDYDGTIRLWDVVKGTCVRTFKIPPDPEVGSVLTSLCLSRDGQVAISSSHKAIQLWDVNKGHCVHEFERMGGHVTSLSLSGDGLLLLSVESSVAHLWNVRTGKHVRTFGGDNRRAESVCLSSDGRWALSGSADGTVCVWNVGTGECVRTLEGHNGAVNSVCLSTDGRWALSGGWDKEIRLWFLDWELRVGSPGA